MEYIVTCFTPFGGLDTNSSEQILEYLNIPHEKLPVSWKRVRPILDSLLKSDPDYLILCGQASSYLKPTIELVSTNITRGKDEDGYTETFDETEFVTIPIHTRFDIKYSDLGFAESKNAGTFLCNFSYNYSQLHAKHTKVVFIHFPLINSKEELESYSNMLNSLLKRIN